MSEDSEPELDDGDDGEPGDSPESDDEEEVVPLDELDSLAADVLAFSTKDVERANLVSLRILRAFLRSVAYLLNIWILGPVAPLTGQYSRGGLN